MLSSTSLNPIPEDRWRGRLVS